MRGMIHYAKLAGSARLQKVLRHLSDGQPHTTLDIIQATGMCAINSIVTELRMNGIRIKCNAVKGFRGRYEYTLGRV